MGVIRISQRSEGIEDYLEGGHKAGREHTRDEMDQRVPLHGDLEVFRQAVMHSRKHKTWREHYWHITEGFATENTDLSDDKLREITRDVLTYYYGGQQKIDELAAYVEAHRPRIKTLVDRSTGEVVPRLLHLHFAVAKLNPVTGNQVRMLPYGSEADAAFQSWLCKKHGLVDPATRRRDVPLTRAHFLARHKGDEAPAKQTVVAELRAMLADALKDVQSIEAALEILAVSELVRSVKLRQTMRNTYFHVETTLGTQGINLRGKGFESLERLYGTQGCDKQRDSTSVRPLHERPLEELEAVWRKHQQWHVDSAYKKRERPRPLVDPEKVQRRLEARVIPRLKAARIYYVIYRSNISEELIRGWQVWERANQRYMVNKAEGIKVYDKGDRIVLSADDPEAMRKGIRLALEVAQAKGWNLDTMRVTGSPEFRAAVQRQIEAIKETQAAQPVVDGVSQGNSAPLRPERTQPNNPIAYAAQQAEDRHQARLSGAQIADIKARLPASQVLEYAAQTYALEAGRYRVVDGNKIFDTARKAKPLNVVDFLTKTCHVRLSDALPTLQAMLPPLEAKQEVAVKIGISNDGPNYSRGWQAREVAKFSELANALKSGAYSACVDFQGGHRTNANVRGMGNVVIFDVDNDDPANVLPLDEARARLSFCTNLIITSRNHQREKVTAKGDVKPAVDRYRIVVPVTEPMPTNKEEYRACMAAMAERLGIAKWVDQAVLKDPARMYFPSPQDAGVAINNTGAAYDNRELVQTAVEAVRKEREAMQEQIKIALPTARQGLAAARAWQPTLDMPLTVNIEAMLRLPLPEVYERYTGYRVTDVHGYLMAKGHSAGTSRSRESLTMLQADDHWIWHDLKTQESGNVLTLMRQLYDADALRAAQQLEADFNVPPLVAVNLSYYKARVDLAMQDATNDRSFEDKLKQLTGASFVKIERDQLTVAARSFDLAELGYEKRDLIEAFSRNRARAAAAVQKPPRLG